MGKDNSRFIDYNKVSIGVAAYAKLKFGELKAFDVICYKCGNACKTFEKEKLFPRKNRYFCSIGCQNSNKRSDDFKERLRDKQNKIHLASGTSTTNSCRIFFNKCVCCHNIFVAKKKEKKTCSANCLFIIRSANSKISGKISVAKRTLRSKNEILFANLCGWFFEKIETNKPIFNGWDADVIVHDLKIAVLWNGPWHYRKITQVHSLEQVQNRDKIKTMEIIKYGYLPYVIRDNGKHDELFVQDQFLNFIETYSLALISH